MYLSFLGVNAFRNDVDRETWDGELFKAVDFSVVKSSPPDEEPSRDFIRVMSSVLFILITVLLYRIALKLKVCVCWIA